MDETEKEGIKSYFRSSTGYKKTIDAISSGEFSNVTRENAYDNR